MKGEGGGSWGSSPPPPHTLLGDPQISEGRKKKEKNATRFKPIFHQKLGSRWVPNEMKSTRKT